MSTAENSLSWPDRATQVGERIPTTKLHADALAWLARADSKRVLVACSGGADSLALLCVLWAHAAALQIELVVAHYNHRWRASAADADAAFVEALAKDLDCSYVTAARPDAASAFSETSARALRLSFLREAAQAHGCQCIAFGHQLDDILETQLQRLARGVGSAGLAAPRPVHIFEEGPPHLRPLLTQRADAIRAYLKACSVPWREDASNQNTTIARNALRQHIIPQLTTALDREVSAGAARTRQLVEEDAIALDALARAQFPAAFDGAASLDRESLRTAHRALVRRALVAWLAAHQRLDSISAAALEALLDGVASTKVQRMSAGIDFIEMATDSVRLVPGSDSPPALERLSLPLDAVLTLPNGARLSCCRVRLTASLREEICRGAIDPKVESYLALDASQALEVRGWLPGDRFQPMGAPGRKKLKDWFVDRQIPQRERKQLPVVVLASEEILWVPGLPPAEKYRIGAGTISALRLTYQIRDSL